MTRFGISGLLALMLFGCAVESMAGGDAGLPVSGNDAGAPATDSGAPVREDGGIDAGSPGTPDAGPPVTTADMLPDPEVDIPLEAVETYDPTTRTGSPSFCPEVSAVRQVTVVEETLGTPAGGTWTVSMDAEIPMPSDGVAALGTGTRNRFAAFEWPISVSESGYYHVEAWVPMSLGELSSDVRYTVTHQNGSEDVDASQAAAAGTWIDLGVVPVDVDEGLVVRLVGRARTATVVADSVRITLVPRGHLGNTELLTWISAAAYSDPVDLLTALERLGFGQPGDAAAARQCEADLFAIRAWEAANPGATPSATELEETFEACGEAWSGGLGEVPASYAAAFEAYLRRVARPGAAMQFFAGGALVDDGATFDAGSTQVVFAPHRSGEFAIVAFRGTELSDAEQRNQDVLADVNLFQVDLEERGWPAGYGEVHRGFLNAYEEVRGALAVKVAELDPGTPIWLTGHSLGAALATIHLADLLRRTEADGALSGAVRPAGLVTFGSPRVGDASFRDQLHRLALRHDVSLLRLRNDRDIVTGVPTIDYAHVGTLIRYRDDASVEYMPPNRLTSFYTSTADHALLGYWDGIRSGGTAMFRATYDRCPIE